MRRPIVILTLLALIWGASFMLIKIADRQLTPSTLILGRLGSATLLLAAIAAVRLGPRRTLEEIRGAWLWLVVVGLMNTAIPFRLLSCGEPRIDSDLAPIALLYGAVFLHESFGLADFASLALILLGVALATGSVRLASLRAGRAEAREAA